MRVGGRTPVHYHHLAAAAAMLPAHAPGARRRAVAAEGSREAHRMSVRLCGTALPADRSFRELLRWASDPACSDGVKTNSVTAVRAGPRLRPAEAGYSIARGKPGEAGSPSNQADHGRWSSTMVPRGVPGCARWSRLRPSRHLGPRAGARAENEKERITTLLQFTPHSCNIAKALVHNPTPKPETDTT